MKDTVKHSKQDNYVADTHDGCKSPKLSSNVAEPVRCSISRQPVDSGSRRRAKREMPPDELEARRRTRNQRKRELRASQPKKKDQINENLCAPEPLLASLTNPENAVKAAKETGVTNVDPMTDMEKISGRITSLEESCRDVSGNMKKLAFRFAVITKKQQTLVQKLEERLDALEQFLRSRKVWNEQLEQNLQALASGLCHRRSCHPDEELHISPVMEY
ncbi:Hypothetical protein D9617_45g091300 [Elsinoe fawcettii]|nr:Hypothetical protein D9617_45g091300 [Elsinoe fawcettii]